MCEETRFNFNSLCFSTSPLFSPSQVFQLEVAGLECLYHIILIVVVVVVVVKWIYWSGSKEPRAQHLKTTGLEKVCWKLLLLMLLCCCCCCCCVTHWDGYWEDMSVCLSVCLFMLLLLHLLLQLLLQPFFNAHSCEFNSFNPIRFISRRSFASSWTQILNVFVFICNTQTHKTLLLQIEQV